ncbi:hypothetical protein [Uliginosibacterium sp. H1]|uniref:hypothetical protein n=1 Tax=Uliginosibacterium sp. H1 TaxID=3114757 RepID=UPI002E195A6D|nr:hypothetical protein [Uliginosibacterium sp. H1]
MLLQGCVDTAIQLVCVCVGINVSVGLRVKVGGRGCVLLRLGQAFCQMLPDRHRMRLGGGGAGQDAIAQKPGCTVGSTLGGRHTRALEVIHHGGPEQGWHERYPVRSTGQAGCLAGPSETVSRHALAMAYMVIGSRLAATRMSAGCEVSFL